MLTLTIKLLIAHVLGDFVFQPNGWVADKKAKKHKSTYLYLHGLVHLLSLLLVLGFNWSYWPFIITIVGSHLTIDLAKLNLENSFNNNLLFITDQLLHLIVIGIVVYLIEPFAVNLGLVFSTKFLLLILAILTVTAVSSIVMKKLMNKWKLAEDNTEDSLNDAGKYIGILERLFVFGFIILNQWSAIGFLIAAKSVFRFGDLSRAKDRKLTEYILIGTLMSFGLAVFIGLLYKYVLTFIL